jgi:hypothetical protein
VLPIGTDQTLRPRRRVTSASSGSQSRARPAAAAPRCRLCPTEAHSRRTITAAERRIAAGGGAQDVGPRFVEQEYRARDRDHALADGAAEIVSRTKRAHVRRLLLAVADVPVELTLLPHRAHCRGATRPA